MHVGQKRRAGGRGLLLPVRLDRLVQRVEPVVAVGRALCHPSVALASLLDDRERVRHLLGRRELLDARLRRGEDGDVRGVGRREGQADAPMSKELGE